MKLLLSLTLIGLGIPALAQSPSPPVLDRQWLAGTWKLDTSGPAEDTKSWDRLPFSKHFQPAVPCPDLNPRRELDGSRAPDLPCNTASSVRGPGEVGPVNYEASKIYSVRAFGLHLLIPSETIALAIGRDAVIIDDDIREPTRHATDKPTTVQITTRSAYRSPAGFSQPTKPIKVRVSTSWDGDVLVQEVRTRDLEEIVKIRRTFAPVDQGRKMLLMIRVLEPKLKDPVKDIERLYTKANW